MSSRTDRYRARLSLGVLVGLTIAAGLFAYAVSPLRDPAFQPNSANGGSLLPWMQAIQEKHWLWTASILAGLLATNIAIVLRQRFPASRPNPIARLMAILLWLTMGFFLFAGFWMGFVGYLLGQWLID
ncbi:hypothetical protein IFO70_16635 [Phormidium tenue FACHB-886]|nr:hypothetical protein [Phormidium tenue FACHB-886]